MPDIYGSESQDSGRWLDSTIDFVARILRKHGMNLSDYNHRSPEQMLKDLNEAWDRIKRLEKSATEKDSEILALKDNIKWLRRWRSILAGLIIAALSSTFISIAKTLLGLPH